MTEDPYARPSWDAAPPWPNQPPAGHGPSAPSYPPGPQSYPPYPPGPQSYPPGGPETLSYPAPPDAAPPHGGFSWRDASGQPPPPPRRPIGRILVVIGAILALIAAGVAAYLLVPRFTAARAPATPAAAAPEPTAPAAAPPAAPAPPSAVTLTATADCVSTPSRDAAGTVVDYGPEKMVDGRADTAWRCDGDGAGKTVRVAFDRPVRVVEVGIVAGYAKTDPTDGTDRFAQNRRIAAVRYAFDDGTTVDQTLRTGLGDRSPQTVAVPGVTSSGMTITIVRSVPGSAVGSNMASDRIAVSELEVLVGTG